MLSLRRTAYVHLLGVGAVAAAILLDGVFSHDTGVAVAIGIVVLLDARPLPAVTDPERIKLVVGSVGAGGIRQGQFIKLCFTTALIASGGIQHLLNAPSGVPTTLLGAAAGLIGTFLLLRKRSVNSRIIKAAETEILKLSVKPYMGMRTYSSAFSIAQSDNPSISVPNIRATGPGSRGNSSSE